MNQLLRKNVHPLRDCGGVPIYISDNSPVGTTNHVLQPFLQHFGLKTSPLVNIPVSFLLMYSAMLSLWATIWRNLGWPSKLESTTPPYTLQSIAANVAVVNRARAELSLKFKPPYTWEESHDASVKYYEKLIEERACKAVKLRRMH